MKLFGALSGMCLGESLPLLVQCRCRGAEVFEQGLTRPDLPSAPSFGLRALDPAGTVTGLYIWDQPIRRGIEDMFVQPSALLLMLKKKLLTVRRSPSAHQLEEAG